MPPLPNCKNCGAAMQARRGTYCSKKQCKSAAYRARKVNAPRCKVEGCRRPVQARTLCGSHYAAQWRVTNTDMYRAKNARYRAAKRAAFVESVSPQRVYEMDGWKCHLCGKKIDKKLKFPDMMAATLDHVVPLSSDGEHSYENCRAAHNMCNSTKRNHGSGEQMLLLAIREEVA